MPRDGRDSINMLRRPAVAVRRFVLTGRHWQSREMHHWESNGQSGGMSGAAEGRFALSDRKVSLWYTLTGWRVWFALMGHREHRGEAVPDPA